MGKVMIAMIVLYQKYISPFKMNTCRYQPTCSSYMIQAVERYGAAGGLYRGLKRVLRCHPFRAGGYDPID